MSSLFAAIKFFKDHTQAEINAMFCKTITVQISEDTCQILANMFNRITDNEFFDSWCVTVLPHAMLPNVEKEFRQIEYNLKIARECFALLFNELEDMEYANLLNFFRTEHGLDFVDIAQGVVSVPNTHYVQLKLKNGKGMLGMGALFVHNSHTEIAVQ